MALNSKATVAVAVMAAVVLMMFAGEASALTCGDVDSKLAQCVSYATGRVSSLSAGCCNGVRGLNALANNTPNRQMACKCLKSLANSIKSIDMGKVSAVPGKCGVSVPFPISMSTDCNKVR